MLDEQARKQIEEISGIRAELDEAYEALARKAHPDRFSHASDAVRHPLEPLPAQTRAELLRLAGELDVLALRWGK